MQVCVEREGEVIAPDCLGAHAVIPETGKAWKIAKDSINKV